MNSILEEVLDQLKKKLDPGLQKMREATQSCIAPRNGYMAHAAAELGRCAGMLAMTGGIMPQELEPLLKEFPTGQRLNSIPNADARTDAVAKFRSLCCLMMIGEQLHEVSQVIMSTAVEAKSGLSSGLKEHGSQIVKAGSMEVEMIMSDGYSNMARDIMTGLANYFTAHMGITMRVTGPAATPPEATKQEPVPTEVCKRCGKQH